MLRAVLPPLVTAYAVFAVTVLLAIRRPVARPRLAARPPGRTSITEIIATAAGGYLVFLVIVLVFHVWLAGEGDTFASAAGGGTILVALALVVSAVGGAARRALRARTGGRSTR